jgi:hypothetical protein
MIERCGDEPLTNDEVAEMRREKYWMARALVAEADLNAAEGLKVVFREAALEQNRRTEAAEQRATRAEGALAVLGRIAQYDPRWVGMHVNDAPNRQQIIAMAYDAATTYDQELR